MKNLKDYKLEINRCSKCGLCQSVCPIYKITGNDCTVSRGKFIMLRGVIKGELSLNKNINKYLDMCLKCNACKDFCPSDIDARKIFVSAKSEYFKTSPEHKIITLFESENIFKIVLNLIRLASNTYRNLNLQSIADKFYPIFLKMGWLGRKAILANEFVKRGSPKNASSWEKSFNIAPINQPLKVIYFKGCVNNYINPKVKNASEKVLEKMGVKIIPVDFECCGMPFLSSGNTEQFKKQAEFNLSKIPDKFDYFLTDCASCQDAFKDYENYVDNKKLLEKLQKINEKSINISDFIMQNVESISFSSKKTVTFHKPCHLEDMSFFYKFIDKSINVEYFEMQDFNKCCGFSGEFAIKNPKLSEEVSKEKAQNAINTGAEYILTTCPACVLGITQGLIKNAKKDFKMPKVLNMVEFIAMADSVKIKKQQNKENTKFPDFAQV